MPAQRCKVLIVVFDVPQLNEEIVRAGYYEGSGHLMTASGVGQRTKALAFGIILAISDPFRMTFESALHLSGLPVPHLHGAVITC